MNKIHTSLRPKTSIFQIVFWSILGLLFYDLCSSYPVVMILVGCSFGIAGGIMQTLSLREAGPSILETKTMPEIRAQLMLTTWGKRYVYFSWSGGVLLLAIAFCFSRSPFFAFALAYSTFYVAREAITLLPLFYLHRMYLATMDTSQNC
jgi:hypothetical protein